MWRKEIKQVVKRLWEVDFPSIKNMCTPQASTDYDTTKQLILYVNLMEVKMDQEQELEQEEPEEQEEVEQPIEEAGCFDFSFSEMDFGFSNVFDNLF